jgi:hypothetical protein
MKNGFLFPVFDKLFEKLCYLNLVELFKYVANIFNKQKNDKDAVHTYRRFGTDVFILFKWVLVIVLWKFKFSNSFLTVTVWYLIVTNLYTYFIYHVWHKDALKTDEYLIDRAKRRFLNLMLAIAFSIFCFGYLINVPYVNDFNWSEKSATFLHALWFSFSNSLAANYSVVAPLTDDGNIVCNLELLITFIFVTIILSRSVPQTNSNN